MTREEALKKLADIIFNAAKSGYMPYDTNDELCAMSIAKKHIDDFYTSLPSNLDEAAEEQWAAMEYVSNTARESTSVRDWCTNDIVDAFKAGAEWMAKQGVTSEQIVDKTPLNGPKGIMVYLYDFDCFNLGDKVIVQIRKK